MRLYLEGGLAALARDGKDLEDYAEAGWFALATEREARWREHGADVLADWIRQSPGSRPWAWWRWDAREPRRVVRGEELLMPVKNPGDWAWVWRADLGVPAFRQCRPPGYLGLPAVESQASHLLRLGVLGGDERTALAPDAWAPEEIDPFIISSAEIDTLLRLSDNGSA